MTAKSNLQEDTDVLLSIAAVLDAKLQKAACRKQLSFSECQGCIKLHVRLFVYDLRHVIVILWPQSLYDLSNMKNQHGHKACWMSIGKRCEDLAHI